MNEHNFYLKLKSKQLGKYGKLVEYVANNWEFKCEKFIL